MSAQEPAAPDRFARWPAWLRPRDEEDRGVGNVRLAEGLALGLIGIVFAVATVNDLARLIGVNHRRQADLNTWRAVTGHDYRNLAVEQDLTGGTRDVVCGNVTPGAPGVRVQICLVMTGAVLAGRRATDAGYFLAPHEADGPHERIGCFGPGSAGLCSPTTPRLALPAPPALPGAA